MILKVGLSVFDLYAFKIRRFFICNALVTSALFCIYNHGLSEIDIKKRTTLNDSGVRFWQGRLDSNQRNDGVRVRSLTAWRRPYIQ